MKTIGQITLALLVAALAAYLMISTGTNLSSEGRSGRDAVRELLNME